MLPDTKPVRVAVKDGKLTLSQSRLRVSNASDHHVAWVADEGGELEIRFVEKNPFEGPDVLVGRGPEGLHPGPVVTALDGKFDYEIILRTTGMILKGQGTIVFGSSGRVRHTIKIRVRDDQVSVDQDSVLVARKAGDQVEWVLEDGHHFKILFNYGDGSPFTKEEHDGVKGTATNSGNCRSNAEKDKKYRYRVRVWMNQNGPSLPDLDPIVEVEDGGDE